MHPQLSGHEFLWHFVFFILSFIICARWESVGKQFVVRGIWLNLTIYIYYDLFTCNSHESQTGEWQWNITLLFLYRWTALLVNLSLTVYDNCVKSNVSVYIINICIPFMSFSTSVLQRCRQFLTKCSSSSVMLWGAGCGGQSMGCLHWVKGLYMGVRWQLDTLETRPSDGSVSSGSLRGVRKASMTGWKSVSSCEMVVNVIFLNSSFI